MCKYIITFGSDHLTAFKVRALKVAIIIEAKNEQEARKLAFAFDGLGEKFCTSYEYNTIKKSLDRYGIKIITLEDLEKLRL